MYFDLMNASLNLQTSDGEYHWAGIKYWQYIDQRNESANWGFVTPRDNAYDGVEARPVRGRDAFGYETGCLHLGTLSKCELATYGDFITPAANANHLWLDLVPRVRVRGRR